MGIIKDKFGSGEYEGVNYILLEEIQPLTLGRECGARAVAANAQPDEDGYYPCQFVYCNADNFDEIEIVDVDKPDDKYNPETEMFASDEGI